jgi:SsrA-binding protein
LNRSGESGHIKVIATNRRARRNYTVVETYEAGLALLGSEVKSLREGKVDLKDSYGDLRQGELFLIGVYVAPYEFAREGGHDPERPRKLLLHRREIDKIAGRVAEKGLTLVPLQLYFKDGRAKVEIGLARGKTSVDKRQALRDRDHQREIERATARTRRSRS